MRTIAIGTFIAFALAGCGSGKDSGGDSTTTATGTGTGAATGTGTGTTTGSPLTIDVLWTDDGNSPTDTDSDGLPDIGCGDSVAITISDPLGMTAWDFGMAEDGANGWKGEDCLTGQGNFTYCHPIGINHTLNEVTDCALPITEGSETLLDAEKDPFLTYYVADSTGACFVFGTDTAYYASLSCTEMM